MDKAIINIVYSKSSKISKCLIDEIYKHFTYNLDEKFSINLGYSICLYEISEDLPKNFHRDALTIFLISNHFFVNAEKIKEIANKCNNDTILPVGLCDNAHRLFETINIVRLNYNQIDTEKYKLLCIIARKFISKSVHIFLSYYRTESEKVCKNIQNIISSIPDFNGFVDTSDISYGKDMQTEIDNALNDGLLMCISTDKYSERIWCAHELIYAKEKDIPIIILDCLSNCETRRSPYSGNVPVYKMNKVSEESVTTALFLLLKEKLRKDINKKTTDKNEVYYLWKAPELSRIIQIKNDNNQISKFVYPAPPLPICEIEYYKNLIEGCEFILDNDLQNLQLKQKINIAISLSDTQSNKELHPNYLNSVISELIRYLIYGNYQILYGGDWRKSGYTELILDYITAYKNHHKYTQSKLVNYFVNLKGEDKGDLLGKIFSYGEIKFIDPVFTNDKLIDRAESLTKMRTELIKDANALISLAGDMSSERIPGIVEEVCKAIFYNKPVFLLGAAGGATRWLIDRIVNQDIESIELNGNPKCINEIKSALKDFTVENLSDLNKLQSSENEKLFYSYDIKEVINILFNGLMRIQ